MTHAPATAAATPHYAAAARHPLKRPLPESAGSSSGNTTTSKAGVAGLPAPRYLAPRAPNGSSSTSPSPSPIGGVAPAPLPLPQGLPAARVSPLLVRLAPGAPPHARQALEAIDRATGRRLPHAYLLVDQLCKPKDRVRLWLARVLAPEQAEGEQQQAGSVVWAPVEGDAGLVVVKESDARFIREYGQAWGEDPIAEVAALAAATTAPHPNVVPALACFEGVEGCQGLLYLILPRLAGEELFYLVTEAPGRQGLGEAAAKPLARQVVAGLLHLKRAHGLRHGDVSPENVVVSPDGHRATLIDLGMAERVPPQSSHGPVVFHARPRRGKKQYMAPEIYEERAYDPYAADVWALGAMLYVCWTGCTVYRSPTDPHYLALRAPGGLQRLLREREAKGATRALSPEAKDLLARMLAWDYRQRPSLEAVLAHPWFGGFDDDEAESDGERTDEGDDDEDPFLLSASTSFSSLGLAEAAAAAAAAVVVGMEQEEEAEAEAEAEAPVVVAVKKRNNNDDDEQQEEEGSSRGRGLLESLHEQNNNSHMRRRLVAAAALGAAQGEEGETSDEEEDGASSSASAASAAAATAAEGLLMMLTPPVSPLHVNLDGGDAVPFFE